MTEEQYIADRVDGQLEWYSARSWRCKRWFFTLQVLQILIGAAVPFLAAQLTAESLNLKYVIALLGALVAIAGGIVTLYRFQENWIEFRSTAEALKQEKYFYLTRTGPYAADKPFPTLVERVEAILGKQHSRWVGRAQQERPVPADA